MFSVTTPTSIMLGVDVDPPEGAGAPGAFTIDVRYLGQRARVDYLKRITDESLTDPQILDDLLVGWDGVVDESEAHLEFNDIEIRRRVLDVPWVYEAIRDAVLREIGLSTASEKNS